MNFTSQICTTKEQSERLLALGLKKETADMVLLKELAYDEKRHCLCDADTYMIRPIDYLNGEEHRDNIPAWSLHRLLEMYLDNYLWEYIDLKLLTYDTIIEEIRLDILTKTFNKEYLEKK